MNVAYLNSSEFSFFSCAQNQLEQIIGQLQSDDPMDTVTDTFNVYVDVGSQVIAGRTVCANTIKWWGDHTDASAVFIDATNDGLGIPLEQALKGLLEFIPDDVMVYARGPDFESGHLSNACESVGLKWCRRYNRMDDVRSFINARTGGYRGYIDMPNQDLNLMPHVSLDDCIRDALEMKKALMLSMAVE